MGWGKQGEIHLERQGMGKASRIHDRDGKRTNFEGVWKEGQGSHFSCCQREATLMGEMRRESAGEKSIIRLMLGYELDSTWQTSSGKFQYSCKLVFNDFECCTVCFGLFVWYHKEFSPLPSVTLAEGEISQKLAKPVKVYTYEVSVSCLRPAQTKHYGVTPRWTQYIKQSLLFLPDAYQGTSLIFWPKVSNQNSHNHLK